jgi:hypothetical protein
MLEVLQFVFSSFWVWLGTVVLVGVVTTSLASFIVVARGQ